MLEKDYLLTQKTCPKEMQQQAVVYPAMHNGCCFRCGQSFLDEARLPSGVRYCRACIQMGRILETDTFYVVRDKKLPRHDYLT